MTTLMPHQCAAADKLSRLRVGALFMDMGTGKSLVAIELARRKEQRIDRVVWFCPVSLRETVRREILKHLPIADVYVFGDATTNRNIPESAKWIVVGIESMSQSSRIALAARSVVGDRTMVVLDESTYCKTPWAKRTERITAVAAKARYRLILTGTPTANGIQDLFAQLFFLDERILGYKSWYSFAANHLEYSEKHPGLIVRAHNTDWLAAKMAPYVYQVSKEECLDLPSKLQETRFVRLTSEQREAYDQAKDEIMSEYMDAPSTRAETTAIYRLFSALATIACGFWNYRGPLDAPDRKCEMREFNEDRTALTLSSISAIDPQEPVVVWCRWHQSLGKLVKALGDVEPIAQHHGRQSSTERTENLTRWLSGERRILLATPATGGHGLNLFRAAHAVFHSDGFNWSEREQAEDRIHRIGQTRPVVYTTIVASGTIDERIQDALAKKGRLAVDFARTIAKIRDKTGRVQALKELLK